MCDSEIGECGSSAISVLPIGTPFSKWYPPTVVLPSCGKAGTITAASYSRISSILRVSAAICPLSVESIFL